eukprot:SAG31_NODE_24321_length_484_cov_0.924675_1_plen_94_part_00
MAENGKLDPVIGRDEEIRRVIQVSFHCASPSQVLSRSLVLSLVLSLSLSVSLQDDEEDEFEGGGTAKPKGKERKRRSSLEGGLGGMGKALGKG